MDSRIEALVTPSVMEWARIKASLDIHAAAKKIGRDEDEVKAWEAGTLRPSLAQARKASEVYRRSLAVFYLPEPPKDFDTIRDFRRLPEHAQPGYSPALSLLIRRALMRQFWLKV